MKEVLYRLDRYECDECQTSFLVDQRWITNIRKEASPRLLCPVCGSTCECSASTGDHLSDELESWGCAYPNGLTMQEEFEWKAKRTEVPNERT